MSQKLSSAAVMIVPLMDNNSEANYYLLNKILTSNIMNNWENRAQTDQINWLFNMQYGPI